jgi:hypothetical protein
MVQDQRIRREFGQRLRGAIEVPACRKFEGGAQRIHGQKKNFFKLSRRIGLVR